MSSKKIQNKWKLKWKIYFLSCLRKLQINSNEIKFLRNTKRNCENKLKFCAINADKDFQQNSPFYLFILVFYLLMCEAIDNRRGTELFLKSCFIVFKCMSEIWWAWTGIFLLWHAKFVWFRVSFNSRFKVFKTFNGTIRRAVARHQKILKQI